MRVEEYDPTVNPSFIDEIDATRWIDGEGRIHFSSGTQNRYVILAMDSPASTLRVFVTAEGDVIVVDDRLLGGADG